MWGAFFLIVCIYSFAGTWILSNWARRVVDRRAQWKWIVPSEVEHAAVSNWSLQLSDPLTLWPFFRWTLHVTARHGQNRTIETAIVLPPQLDHEFSIPALRGRYEVEMELRLNDSFSLSKTRFVPLATHEWTVSPELGSSPFPDYLSVDSGPRQNFRAKKRTDDLLEVRKYVPGDDIRRLHWQLYAHAGEPFLRLGEETPPPTGKISIVVDPSVPSAVPKTECENVLDVRLASLRGYLAALESEGWHWEVLVPQFDRKSGKPMRFSYADSPILNWEAKLAPIVAQAPQVEALMQPLPRSVVLYSSVGSPGMQTIAQFFSDNRISVRPLLHAANAAKLPAKRPWWRKV